MSNKKVMPETIADIAYLAGSYGYYSGDSRADMQTFIRLAEKFEKKYKGIDWNDLGHSDHPDYMEAVEKFAMDELKLKNKLILNYPHAFDSEWDNLEIERCRDDGENTYPIHDEDDVEPGDFWSVYVHPVDGGTMCLADVPTEEDAIALRDTISFAVKMFKDNKYMKLYSNKNLQEEFNKELDKAIEKTDKNNVHHFTVTSLKKEFNDLFI